ncbi:MAG: PA2169 family four-helix-bundle protein [Phormidesmis sp. FL-bin-119]|nr:PA2169 family four-helix-bundle protein [Pedobacter sp.]
METKESTGVLNDLILINNDRIEGYQKAKEELKEGNEDLKALFTAMIGESHTLKMALATEVSVMGEDIEEGTTNSGKIYRVWMDVKAAFSGHDRKAVLENCEFGEDAAQKAYQMALGEDDLPGHIRTMLSDQKATLRLSHDKIKALRDAQV